MCIRNNGAFSYGTLFGYCFKCYGKIWIFTFYFCYLYETMLSAITYQLGQNQLDVLMDFMKEPGLLPCLNIEHSKLLLIL